MSYDRTFVDGSARRRRRTTARGARCGRWASPLSLARDEGQRHAGAADVRARPAAHATELGPRGTRADDAGADELPRRVTRRSAPAAELLARLARPPLPTGTASRRPPAGAGSSRRLTYDNALLPLALLRAHALTRRSGEPATSPRESLEFLEATCFRDDRLRAGRQRRLAPPRRDAVRRRRAADRRRGVRARVPRRVPRHARPPLPAAHARGVRLVSRRQPPGRLAVYDSATAGCRDGLGDERAESEPGRREHHLPSCCRSSRCWSSPARASSTPTSRRRRERARRSRSSMITRTSHRLLHDPSRVIAKPYLPGEEICHRHRHARRPAHGAHPRAPGGRGRARAGARRSRSFGGRHREFEELLERHFALVAHHVGRRRAVARAAPAHRRLLHQRVLRRGRRALQSVDRAGARSGRACAPGEQRFVMSLRAVGEGHISSIEFRTGVDRRRQRR